MIPSHASLPLVEVVIRLMLTPPNGAIDRDHALALEMNSTEECFCDAPHEKPHTRDDRWRHLGIGRPTNG